MPSKEELEWKVFASNTSNLHSTSDEFEDAHEEEQEEEHFFFDKAEGLPNARASVTSHWRHTNLLTLVAMASFATHSQGLTNDH